MKISPNISHWLEAVMVAYVSAQVSGLIVITFFQLITGRASFTEIPLIFAIGFLNSAIPIAIYALVLGSIAVKLARNPHAFKLILVTAIVVSLFFFLFLALLMGGEKSLIAFDALMYMLLYSSLIAGALGGLAAVASLRQTLSKVEERA